MKDDEFRNSVETEGSQTENAESEVEPEEKESPFRRQFERLKGALKRGQATISDGEANRERLGKVKKVFSSLGRDAGSYMASFFNGEMRKARRSLWRAIVLSMVALTMVVLIFALIAGKSPSISIAGETLKLGETRQDILARFESRFELQQFTYDGSWLLREKKGEKKVVGELSFKNDVLMEATRFLGFSSEPEAIERFQRSLELYARKFGNRFTITSDRAERPGFQYRVTTLNAKKNKITITTFTKDGHVSVVWIGESIGERMNWGGLMDKMLISPDGTEKSGE